MKRKVSVIIPTYNCASYLPKCISSILKNDCSRIEIFIIDDGSTDNTFEIMKEYSSKYSFIRYLKKENSGPSLTRNFGLELITTDYFTFMDADDYVSDDYFQKIYELIDTTEADLFHFNKLIREEDKINYYISDKISSGLMFNVFENYTKFLIGHLKKDKEKKYSVSIQKNIFKTEILKKYHVRFIEKNIYYAEDRIFLITYLKYVKSMFVYNDGYYHYQYRSNSLMNGYDNKKVDKLIISYHELYKEVTKLYSSSDVLARLNAYYISRIIFLVKEELKQSITFDIIKNDIEKLLKKSFAINYKDLHIKDNLFIHLIIKKKLTAIKILMNFENVVLKIKNFLKKWVR